MIISDILTEKELMMDSDIHIRIGCLFWVHPLSKNLTFRTFLIPESISDRGEDEKESVCRMASREYGLRVDPEHVEVSVCTLTMEGIVDAYPKGLVLCALAYRGMGTCVCRHSSKGEEWWTHRLFQHVLDGLDLESLKGFLKYMRVWEAEHNFPRATHGKIFPIDMSTLIKAPSVEELEALYAL